MSNKGKKRREECKTIIEEFHRSQSTDISERPFRVTPEWIRRNTNFCSPNSLQLAILGESWPLEVGWLERLSTLRISHTSRMAFESAIKNKSETDTAPPMKALHAKDPTWKWTFGKHSGRLLSETPIEYLDWVAENFKNGEIKDMAIREIHRRNTTSSPAVATKQADLFHEANEPPERNPLTQGRYDCSHLYDPNYDWPEEQPWDGESPPWEDQCGSDELSAEFKAIVS